MIVKIWPIKASYPNDTFKVGGTEGIKNTLEYITDAEKVMAKQEDIQQLDEENQTRVFTYMSNEDKIEGKYISGYMCSPDSALSSFDRARELTQQKLNRKIKNDDGAIAFHMIQSFPEGLNISNEEVHQCGLELCEKLKAHQAVICSHVHPMKDDDGVMHGKCKHNHILFNAYIHPDKLDPEHPGRAKYNDCKETYAQLRVWNDEIAIAHGLPIIRNPDDDRVYSWKENDEINKDTSWKQRIRLDILDARRAATNWEEFVDYMEEAGYKIKDGTHTSYTAPDGKHVARGKTLGRLYTKESLELYWEVRDYALHAVKQDEKLNSSPALLDTVLAAQGPLSVAVPLGMRSQEQQQYYYLPLENVKQSNAVITTYFNEKDLYDICDENNRPIAAATGKEIMECIDKLRDGKQPIIDDQKKPEEERQEDARRRQKQEEEKKEKEKYYTYFYFINSRTKKRYRSSLYDDNGRRRTLLELMFLLAITVLKKEDGLWEPVITPVDAQNDPLYAPRAWKIQNMLDSIHTAREEDIETPAELDLRLKNAGSALSRARSAEKKVKHTKEKMETLNEAVLTYRKTAAIARKILEMPDGPEKEKLSEQNKDILDSYKSAKAVMYHYKVNTEEEIADFEQRYAKIQVDIQGLEERVEQAKEEYRRLKKLSYNVELAQNTQYCYGPEYSYDYSHMQEQERGSDDARNKQEEKDFNRDTDSRDDKEAEKETGKEK